MSQIKAFVYLAGASFLLLLQSLRLLFERTFLESLVIGTIFLCVFAIAEMLEKRHKK